MRTLIVHNPNAGFGSDAIFEFEHHLLQAGDECVMRMLTGDPSQEDAALEDAESFDVVVVSGGDGTVSHALYTLRNRGVRTCLFPSGTANLLASNIGNALEPAALASSCRTDDTATVDLGQITWTDSEGTAHVDGFGIMAGVGFDAQLMHDALPGKQLLGEAAYFAAALANPRPPVYEFTITVDGEAHHRRGIACIVANTAMIQGDIEIIPDCTMDDGLLDVIVVETSDIPQLLAPLMAGIVDPSGREVKRPHLTSFKGAHVTIESDRPALMQMDGEVLPHKVSSWEAKALPGCSRIVVDRFSRYRS